MPRKRMQARAAEALPRRRPDGGQRKAWRPNAPVYGPIGLLINATHKNAATIELNDDNMKIHQHKEIDIDIATCPWQFLSIAVEEMAIRNRSATVAMQRALLRNHNCEIDKALYIDTLRTHQAEDQRWLKHVGNLGIWAGGKLATLTVKNNPQCR